MRQNKCFMYSFICDDTFRKRIFFCDLKRNYRCRVTKLIVLMSWGRSVLNENCHFNAFMHTHWMCEQVSVARIKKPNGWILFSWYIYWLHFSFFTIVVKYASISKKILESIEFSAHTHFEKPRNEHFNWKLFNSESESCDNSRTSMNRCRKRLFKINYEVDQCV